MTDPIEPQGGPIKIPGIPTTAEGHLKHLVEAIRKYNKNPDITEQADLDSALEAAEAFLGQ